MPRGAAEPAPMESTPWRLPWPGIAIVDDDESVRESLPDLLKELGFPSVTFASAESFLNSGCADRIACLILDVAMPEMSGPELAIALARRGQVIPTIYITAHRDEGVRARLLEQGAVDCLFKPFSECSLLGALRVALDRH